MLKRHTTCTYIKETKAVTSIMQYYIYSK